MLAKKRVLFGIAAGIALAFGAVGAVLLYTLLVGDLHVYRTVVKVIVAVLFAIMLSFFIVLSLLALALVKRPGLRLTSFASRLLSVVFAMAIPVCRLLKLNTEKIQASYAEINNSLVRSHKVKMKPEEVLILAPHCLQWSGCGRRITVDVNNCARCGKCTVSGLLDISRRYGVNLTIATGGTVARKKVAEFKPKAIVAIACERDLSSGIQDVNTVPVLGVLNIRPNGPCFDTTVDLAAVEDAVKFFLEEE